MIQADNHGDKVVVLPQVIFKGKKNINWKEIEEYLLQYVSLLVQISDTKDFVLIGRDFADEYTSSQYTRKLKGNLAKTKANMVQGIPEMIQIATDKRWNEDFQNKHGNKAKYGWYRFNTRFALPVLNDEGEIIRYNRYMAVLIIRHASDDKLYLYDIQNIKKETSNPL